MHLKAPIVAITLFIVHAVGCGAWHSLPPTWYLDVPGSYEGKLDLFREVIEFKEDGTYFHKVFHAQREIVSESGRWTVPADRFEIELSPNGTFSQFYDPVTSIFSTNSRPFVTYTYGPLPDGKTFFKISASTEYEFVLTRLSAERAVLREGIE